MPRKTHGLGTTAEYHIWYGMLDRCRNPKSTSWPHYGARGISVCDRWLRFEEFIGDMGRRPDPTMSLDRVNNDGNYEPGNCRWATEIEQQRNRSGIRCSVEMATAIRAAEGKTHKQLALEHGISQSNVTRIRQGAIWK